MSLLTLQICFHLNIGCIGFELKGKRYSIQKTNKQTNTTKQKQTNKQTNKQKQKLILYIVSADEETYFLTTHNSKDLLLNTKLVSNILIKV